MRPMPQIEFRSTWWVNFLVRAWLFTPWRGIRLVSQWFGESIYQIKRAIDHPSIASADAQLRRRSHHHLTRSLSLSRRRPISTRFSLSAQAFRSEAHAKRHRIWAMRCVCWQHFERWLPFCTKARREMLLGKEAVAGGEIYFILAGAC